MKKKFNIMIFWVLLILFILDLFIPDPVPYIDELILGGLTTYYAWKKI